MTAVKPAILFIDSVHPSIAESLSLHGFRCDFQTGLSLPDLEKIVAGYEGIVIRSRIPLDKSFLEKATRLRFIGRIGAGMENIDTEYAGGRNILCLNSPEGNRDAVGEHTLGMLLSLMNHLNRADRQVREGLWRREENRGTEIKGKVIGIIGYGNMGSAFARRLKGFEAEVISYDKYKTAYSDGNTRETGPDEIFEQSDILSLHIPLTEETRYLADRSFFEKFRKKIWFINTSRGPVVNTRDLVHCLETGKIRGAALDVLEYEDSSYERMVKEDAEVLGYLRGSDAVILTPHIAGWTRESAVRLASVLVEKILVAFPDPEKMR